MPGRNKLPRRDSLKRQREILPLIRNGNRVWANGFALRWETADRFGYILVVSKKHGNAVQRNKLKRLFREAIRYHKDRLVRPVRVAIFPTVDEKPPEGGVINAEILRVFQSIAPAIR